MRSGRHPEKSHVRRKRVVDRPRLRGELRLRRGRPCAYRDPRHGGGQVWRGRQRLERVQPVHEQLRDVRVLVQHREVGIFLCEVGACGGKFYEVLIFF